MKLNYKRTILVGFAFFLISAFWQAYDSIVPMMLVNKFGLNQTASGAIMALDNVLALFMLPLFGALSDKTKTKYGKRTPYIVIGSVLAVVMFVSLTFADNMQLSKVYETNDNSSFMETIWEENDEITNLEEGGEYSDNIFDRFVQFFKKEEAKISTQDYIANIVYNKNYQDLSSVEQGELKEYFISLIDHSKDTYLYEDGQYKLIVYDIDSDKYVDVNGNEYEKGGANNVYTNVVVSARSAYAWTQTKSNPVPLVLFFTLLLLTLVSMATFRSPAVALMPDVTIKPLRSKGNAIINLMGAAGGIIVLCLGMIFKTGSVINQMMSYTGFVSAVCAVMVIGLIIFIFTVREPKWAKEMNEESLKLGIMEEDETEENNEEKHKLSKAEFRSLLLILSSVALWYLGYNAVTSKFSLYASTILQKDYNSTLIIAQAAAIVSYVPVGMIASKFGRKKTILAGVIMLATAFFLAIFINSNTSIIILYLLFALAGIGWATINVNSFPMVVELAKAGDTGKYTGWYYTASMAAQALTPVLSGLLMDMAGTMKVLFPYAALFVALAFVTMFFVKHGDSKPLQKKSVLENFDIDD